MEQVDVMQVNNDLVLIVRINEDIKTVVRLARKINLLALNAILLSRRAGSVALGFAVIADELRSFSQQLTQTMQTLMNMSYASVQTVSLYQRHMRMNKLMALTRQQIAGAHLHELVSAKHAEADLLRANLLLTYERLQKLVVDADDASRFGSVIARSLKIEATYGSSFSGLLAQIALEFSQYIDSIPDILNRLQRHLRSTR